MVSVCLLCAGLTPVDAEVAAPAALTRELASKCLSIAYKAFPWRRPGSAPMTDGRYRLYRECLARKGDIAPPPPAE